MISPDALDSIAAFLSGFGSVLTAYFGVRWERNRSRKECEDRINAFKEGMTLGQATEERDVKSN